VTSWASAADASDSEREILKILTDAAYTEVHSFHDALPGGVALQDVIRSLEDNSGRKLNYAPLLVPGLLQTAEYARRLFTLLHIYDDSDIPAVVAARLDRQQALFEADRLFEFLITETALRRPLGPASMMTAQLDRIVTLSTFENVQIGLIPLDSLVRTHVPNGFVIFDGIKDGSAPFVHIETAHASLTARAVGDVQLYRQHWDLLRETAVFDDDARDLLKRVVEDVRKPGQKDS
jgi:Domain of unknown function (DUF5753)